MRTQPAVVEQLRGVRDDEVDWLFGHDGSLTCRSAEGRWWAGCSLPRRAAMAQLKRLELAGAVACFLLPPSAAAIAVALEKLRPELAIIAVVPDTSSLRVMLACHDFSSDIASPRIWFIAGDTWPRALDELFDTWPGLSIPTQFIRLTSSDPEQIEQSIAAAQKVFSEVTARRARQMREARDAWHGKVDSPRRLLVVAPSQFRLWNDWGAALGDACLDDPDCVIVNPDDPVSASPLAVVQRAAQCDAIVTIDTSRADAQGVLPESMPWVTWVTSGSIPARSSAGPNDRIVLLDENDCVAANRAGWDAREVAIAKPQASETAPIAESVVGIIADTTVLDPPANIDDYSSHRPLWEYIADELTRNPFAVGDDADSYLNSRMRKFEVGDQTINRAMFLKSLIVPAYQQGLASALVEAGVPVQIAGKAWADIDRLRRHSTGPVTTREDLATVIARASLLLHVWPDQRAHAIDFAGPAVLRPARNRQRFLREIQDALRNPGRRSAATFSVISPGFLREVLARAR
jgi:hypothetical protein